MNITKFDLYNPEWLEVVFDNRNKAYGAYDLRKNYAGNLSKAMGIAFFSVGVLVIGYSFFARRTPVDTTTVTDVVFTPRMVLPPTKVIPPKPLPRVTPPASKAPTTQYMEFVPKPDVTNNPPNKDELEKTAIGPVTTSGNGTDLNTLQVDPGPATSITGPAPDPNTPVDAGILEVMPEPYGGAAAWSKFLQKNIHYPSLATENGVHGKVFLSFIIEKDGQLSNITVIHGVGSGLDDEAVRVLKLAKPWKPGMQNGHAVRVKYTIPINFQISDPDNG